MEFNPVFIYNIFNKNMLLVPPKVRVTKDKQMIGRGGRVTLECLVRKFCFFSFHKVLFD